VRADVRDGLLRWFPEISYFKLLQSFSQPLFIARYDRYVGTQLRELHGQVQTEASGTACHIAVLQQ
jgi:hypothetical protein